MIVWWCGNGWRHEHGPKEPEMKWTVARMLEATAGRLLQGERGQRVAAVSTDSRQLREGDAFVPLVGERFDGHDFIASAVTKGVRLVLVLPLLPVIPTIGMGCRRRQKRLKWPRAARVS